MVNRIIKEDILSHLFKGKAIILMGPRQTGKTTLIRNICQERSESFLWLNGDDMSVRELLQNISIARLATILGNNRIIVIDEAQRIENIGLAIKMMVDNYPGIQVIASGSSSFEIAEKINEPLTGRKWEYRLFPFSHKELVNEHGWVSENQQLETRLIYGSYPDVINHPGEEANVLNLLTDSFLYKDLFAYEKIKKPGILVNLLKALALQLGNELSYNELAQIIGIDKETVDRYIDALEKSFVVFRLNSFSRNVRNELRRSRKIYFYDNGIRNTILSNYNSLNLRQDTGALWENYFISERMKFLNYNKIYGNSYFWRTTQQQEIDYIEERSGKLEAYELKWNMKKKASVPATFMNAYPNSVFSLVTPGNYNSFLGA
ncbi:MAG: ATP-binding protein [Bacteroidetes bacterium]|nr:ATP-binding protein [Bacteroidota bacterium]